MAVGSGSGNSSLKHNDPFAITDILELLWLLYKSHPISLPNYRISLLFLASLNLVSQILAIHLSH